MRRLAVFACAGALAACHGKSTAPSGSGTGSGSGSGSVQKTEVDVPEEAVAPDVPEGTRSLRLTRSVGVRLEPGEDAKRIGTIADNTRVGWTRTARARGCDKPWIEIAPRGWVCGEYLEPSKRAPTGQEIPHLDRGELVPGTYGKVTGPGAVTYALEKPEDEKKHKKGKHDKKPKHGERDKPVTVARRRRDERARRDDRHDGARR